MNEECEILIDLFVSSEGLKIFFIIVGLFY